MVRHFEASVLKLCIFMNCDSADEVLMAEFCRCRLLSRLVSQHRDEETKRQSVKIYPPNSGPAEPISRNGRRRGRAYKQTCAARAARRDTRGANTNVCCFPMQRASSSASDGGCGIPRLEWKDEKRERSTRRASSRSFQNMKRQREQEEIRRFSSKNGPA